MTQAKHRKLRRSRDMSQPQKKGKQSPAEAAKNAAREKMCEKLLNKCDEGSLVTQKELTRLIKAGADIKWKGPDGFTCLLLAAFDGHLRTVRLLLCAGANKKAKTPGGSTPLFVAAQEGHVAVVNVLLAAGAEKEAKTTEGGSPLYIAAQIGHLAIVEALLADGADKNAKMNDGSTLLIIAAVKGHISIVRALLASGADADASAEDGTTALMQAAGEGRASCVRAILTHGCNVDAVNSRGNTALLCATDENRSECIRLLMGKGGADTSITSAQLKGMTLLEYAIGKGDADAKTIRQLRRVCGTCGVTPDKGKFNKCAACQAMYYCSVECQHVDWPKHKGELEQMKATAENATKAAVAAAAAKASASRTPVVP
jgi:ankyrin repeat protein